MLDCVFCSIIENKTPAVKLYKDEHTLVFLDIHPVNPGHALVVPREHIRTIYDAPEDTLAHIMTTPKKLAIAIKTGVGADGINLMQNNERAAGQLVDHLHLHVVPRFSGDGFTHWKGRKPYAEGEIETVAEKIKSCLDGS